MFVCTRRNSLTDSYSFLQVLSVNVGMSILIPGSAVQRAKVEQMQRFRNEFGVQIRRSGTGRNKAG